MCLRVLDCLERDRCRYLKEFRAAFRQAPCYRHPVGPLAASSAPKVSSQGTFSPDSHNSYCFTTRTPVSVLILFIAAATHTFQARSPSSIFSCAIIGPAMFAIFDPPVADILSDLFTTSSSSGGEIDVVCGYRTSSTNESLRARTAGVAKDSLHIQAEAIDLRMPGIDTFDAFRKAALGYCGSRRCGCSPHSDSCTWTSAAFGSGVQAVPANLIATIQPRIRVTLRREISSAASCRISYDNGAIQN